MRQVLLNYHATKHSQFSLPSLTKKIEAKENGDADSTSTSPGYLVRSVLRNHMCGGLHERAV